MTNSTERQPPLPGPDSNTNPSTPAHLTALIRHFSDLRDGVHGDAVTRTDKEARFAQEVDLLSPSHVKCSAR
jgi:hypothetical protein